MAKLKRGAIDEDKPVKLTVEVPAAIHLDLEAYGQVLARDRSGRNRTRKTNCTDVGAIHRNRSRIC